MNWLDLLMIIIIAILMVEGFYTGMIRKTAQITGIIFGFLMAAKKYTVVANFLMNRSENTSGIVDAISFIFVFVIFFLIFSLAGSLIKKMVGFTPLRVFDRLGGAVIGIAAGVIVAGALLLFATAFPVTGNIDVPLEDSLLGKYTVKAVEKVYIMAEASLPSDIPRIAFQPERVLSENNGDNMSLLSRYRLINFAMLDGSTCIKCSNSLEYLGYLKNDKGITSPKFLCSHCGRSSDGCQSFEGHHLLYDRCPYILGLQGFRTDCGMWPNNDYIRVTLTCPVCYED